MPAREEIYIDADGIEYGYTVGDDGRIAGPEVWDQLTGAYHGDREKLKRVRAIVRASLPGQLVLEPTAPEISPSGAITPWPGAEAPTNHEGRDMYVDPRDGRAYSDETLAAQRAQRISHADDPMQGHTPAPWPTKS